MNDLVSVIVPIYNAEYYFIRCLNSILTQTYNNIEIILVDDGSPDQCPQICDNFALKDSRIKVIHQKNGGLCVARNAGIAIAGGDVICFVDDDDWIPKNSIELLYRKMKNTNADFVCGNYTIVAKPFFNKKSCFWEESVFCIEDKNALENFMPPYFTPWAKLYRKDIIINNELYFDPKINVAEDEYFVFRYMQFCKKIATIPDNVFYHNRLLNISEAKRYHGNYSYCHYVAEKERLKLFNLPRIPYKEQRVVIAVSNNSLRVYTLNLRVDEAIVKFKETRPYFLELSHYITKDFCEQNKDDKFLQRYLRCHDLISHEEYFALYSYLTRMETKTKSLRARVMHIFNKFVPISRFLIFRKNWFYH